MDKILYNGHFYALDETDQQWEAVIIRDGLIHFAGATQEALAQRDTTTELIDLQGQTVLPGFHDSHLHLLSYGYSLQMVDLNDCTSLRELKQRLHAYIQQRELKPGDWIEGRGWDQNLFTDPRMPNRFDLDEEFGRYYVVLTRTCGQISVVTTNVLAQAGILHQPAPVAGGQVETDENGIATGLLTGLATEIVYRIIPQLGVPRIKECILAACHAYATAGLTSVQTDDFELLRAGTFHDILQAYQELDQEGQLPIRVNLMLHLPTLAELDEFLTLGLKTGDGSPYFRIGPFKTIVDGSLGGRTAALREPYSDNPPGQEDNQGELYLTAAQLEQLTSRAAANGLQLVSDSIGDAALRMVLDAFAKIAAAYPDRDLRSGIDHCQITTAGLIEDFAKYRIIGGLELIFLASDIAIVTDRVGPARASLSYNWQRFLTHGVTIAAGSDSPVEDFAPLLGIWAAVNRCDYAGQPLGGYLPEQKLTVREALQAFTSGPAYAEFAEAVKGTITPGKYADLVVLAQDPRTVAPEALRHIPVSQTLVGGVVVYDGSGSL